MTTFIDSIVVGGGQAGLSASWHLKKIGREHIILDRGRAGDTWRRRWDSFCLVTPNWCCKLPGLPYDGDEPEGFMLRDDIVNYIERFAASFAPRIKAVLKFDVSIRPAAMEGLRLKHLMVNTARAT